MTDKFKWTPEIAKSLVKLYELQPVLYNVDSPNYHNKLQRCIAAKTIKMELLKMYKVEIPETVILRKINNLRSQFLDCLKSIKRTASNGADMQKKTVWWLYNNMKFLLPFCNQDKVKSNVHAEKLDLDASKYVFDETVAMSDYSEEIDVVKQELQYSVSPEHESLPSSASYSVESELESLESVVRTPPIKKRKRKDSTDKDNYIKNTIDKTVDTSLNTPVSSSSHITSLCNLIEAELTTIRNKNILKRVKWEILDLIRKAQDDDDAASSKNNFL